MANENQPSGQGQSGQAAGAQGKQQTSEISQGATSAQQGYGSSAGGQQGNPGYRTSSYGGPQGRRGVQDAGAGLDYQRGSQRGQGWQQPSGSALQTRGGTFASPFGGYGGGPFSMMRRITDEMDRLFENFGLGRSFFPSEFGGEAGTSLWSPHVEVSERDGKIIVYADLPGVKKEDVKVEVNPDSITIQGQRNQESTREERGYYHSERVYGSFHRTIPLPEGADIENATATFRDGVLQIELQAPKQMSRGRTLEIKGGDGDGGERSTSGSAGRSGGSGSERQR
jgi:HSP20 family protein